MSAQSLILNHKAMDCPVCKESHWHWTDHHGAARCGECGVTSTLVEGKSPKSTLKSEFLPQYIKWWKLTKGSCTFDEWLNLGKGSPAKEEIEGHRKAETKKEQAEISKRTILIISKSKPYWHTTEDSTGKREREEKKRSDWKINLRKYEEGEFKNYDVNYVTIRSKKEAISIARGMSVAIKAAMGLFNSNQEISIAEHKETTLKQYLKEDWRFWACEPTLNMEVNLNDDNDIVGYRAYLYDPYRHAMHVRSTGQWPDGEGKTKEEAMEALCDHIRGQSIGFAGYHSGSFSAPSNLISGE